jgi:hypothetical protein
MPLADPKELLAATVVESRLDTVWEGCQSAKPLNRAG